MVHPYFIYCNVIWSSTHGIYLRDISLLQKRLIRIITGSAYLEHTDPLFSLTNMLKFEDVCRCQLALYAYKQYNNNRFNYPAHEYVTRNRNTAVPLFQRLSLTQRSLSYSAPRLWNTIPPDVQNAQSVASFKFKLKKSILLYYTT